uniref:CRAL-TRIO domain-containing protein n=1 Tax=Pseudo-nitzschia australis TaxID=44445 RepID=A0A7S4AH44_9STRA
MILSFIHPIGSLDDMSAPILFIHSQDNLVHDAYSKKKRRESQPTKEKTRELCLKIRGGKLGNSVDGISDVLVSIDESSTDVAAENSNSSADGSSSSSNSMVSDPENEEKGENESLSASASVSVSSPITDGTTIEDDHQRESFHNAVDADTDANANANETVGSSERANLAPSVSPSLTKTNDAYRFSVLQKGDGHETDPDGIPARYLKMQGNRRDLAKTALENTLLWRKENDIDTILARPHPKFDVSKAVFPHYFCGRDDTQHVILLQRPGLMNVKLAHKNNLTGEELLFHYIYVMEYLWRIVDPGPEATMTSIIDLTELNISILRKREQLRIGSLFLSTMDAHFPQRSYRTFLINAPKWFGALYKLVSPLLRESTKEKIMILSKGKEQDDVLRDLLRDCPIPEGAKYENVPAGVMEEDLRNFSLARLEESGEEMQPVEPV